MQISRGLLLSTSKVRSLLGRTGAEQLLLKPGGELVALGAGGRTISTVDGKSVITKISGPRRPVASGSVCAAESHEAGSPQKPNVTSPDAKSSAGISDSDQSTISYKTADHELGTNRCTSNAGLKCTAEGGEENSGQTADQSQHPNDVGEQQPDRVLKRKRSEAESASSVPKARHGVGKQRNLTKNRSQQNKPTDIINTDIKNHVNAVPDHEMRTCVVVDGSVSRNTRSAGWPDNKQRSVLPAPVSGSKLKVSDQESSSSELAGGRQTLLEALHLVPASSRRSRHC